MLRVAYVGLPIASFANTVFNLSKKTHHPTTLPKQTKEKEGDLRTMYTFSTKSAMISFSGVLIYIL